MEVPQPDDFQSSSFSHCLSFLNMALSRIWRSWRNPVMEVPQPDAHQSSSLPSSTACSSNYDVFLSFSGKDTRTTFTGHLYRYLVQVGIGTFMDDEELKEGEEIGPNLLKAITESRISIPIFSINYACSKWCLNELVRIMECREKNHQLVLPVFFYVNPGDVRKQIGGFGQKFHRLAKSFDAETVERWQKALKKAGQLKGWELKNGENGNESKMIQIVAERVSSELSKIPINVAKNLVGIDSRVEDIKGLLNVESKDVRIVGICGMGGMGKTTVANAIFNQILCNFEGSSFLGDVREASKGPNGLACLQKQLLSDVLGQEIQSINNVSRGKILINNRFRAKKVLIVLDNVDKIQQLEALAGGFDWFGPGSRIIITTRNEHVLNAHKVYAIYKVKELEFDESLQLFSNHAFGKGEPPEDFMNLAKDVVSAAGGLPLALKVLGSFLCDKDIPEEWISTLERLKKIQPDDIMETLKISYDELDEEESDIFLDIACFFIGSKKEEAIYIWEGCGFYPNVTIKNLIHKSLVDIGIKNELRMHDLLRDMARQIVRHEGRNEPGKRSRLWSRGEALDVLKERTGTRNVKGLLLKLEEEDIAWEECHYFSAEALVAMPYFRIKEFAAMSRGTRNGEGLLKLEEEETTLAESHYFSTEAFAGMSKLRLLRIDNAVLVGNFEFLSSELRWLCWKRCPLETMPHDFHLEKVVVLDLSYSKITQVWNGLHQNKMFKDLKVLKLSQCRHLTRTPDFSRIPNLERLILEGCTQLGEVHESLGLLKRLVFLNLSECSNLTELPSTICNLKSLQILVLCGCSILKKLPRKLGAMESLTVLLADRTAIEHLPNSIGLLKSLRRLCLNGCGSLRGLPDSFGGIKSLVELNWGAEAPDYHGSLNKLEVLEAAGCNLLDRLPVSVGLAINLTTLTLDRTNITELPDSIGLLKRLQSLSLKGCKELVKLPDSIGRLSNLTYLNASYCNISEGEILCAIGKLSSLYTLDLSGNGFCSLPASISGISVLYALLLVDCKRLQSLPNLPSSLIALNASGCSSMEMLSDMSNLTNLKHLFLDETSITELPDSIGLLEKLWRLSLRGCKELVKLPDSIGMLSNLTDLNARHCNISEGGIPSAIGKLSSLERLDLRGNCFCSLPKLPSSLITLDAGGCSSMEMLSDVSNLTNLTSLYLDGTNIAELPDAVGLLVKLETLSLESCKELVKLPDSIGMLSNLTELNAGDCNLSESGISCAIGKLSSLKFLELRGNSFCSLPVSINSISTLQEPDLDSCTNLQFLPGLPSTLEELCAYDCPSMERLPDLSSLTNLCNLSMYNCKKLMRIQGVEGLENIKGLDLSNCEWLEDIQGIEKMESLQSLLLSGCSRIRAGTLRKSLLQAGRSPIAYRSHHLTFPGGKIPDWFTPLKIVESWDEKIGGKVIRMGCKEVLARLRNPEQPEKIIGILVCFVFVNPGELLQTLFAFKFLRWRETMHIPKTRNEDQIHLWHFGVRYSEFALEERDESLFTIQSWSKSDFRLKVKRGGMHMFYETDEEGRDATTLLSIYERMADFFLSSPDDGGGVEC